MFFPLRLVRLVRLAAALLVGGAALAGCSTTGLLLTAAGIATDTSVTWEIAKHVHAKLTQDDPTPCVLLNSVQRALNPRCDYVPGSIRAIDLASTGLQACPLAIATRDPRLWRALPELIAKGARPDRCSQSPLVDLAQAEACPDFAAASPATLQAFIQLADDDPRAVRHDVFRMLGCPKARAVGLERVLTAWLDRGALQPGTLSFSPLGAAHPDLLVGRFGRELEVAGHLPGSALDGYEGILPTGFEEALRTSHWAALEWWLYRLPRLANLAPPARGGQLAWVPLQRVLLPGFLADPTSQREMVVFLMARGADPRARLPFEPTRTVIGFAAAMKSPMLAVLDPPAPAPPRTLRQAALDPEQSAR
ncbi:MAG TPA: hypothetical protein VHM00_14360 [Caldimonas sp.]|jgi:hypothetical protein|nr:hypothetical protein [Caldimonas sp.]HEX2542252.1 hypothetical protein [Caldimonas sp.]